MIPEHLLKKMKPILRWPQERTAKGSESELTALLSCTMCGERKETHSEIVYSQGSRVCLECKKITLEDDKRAFDRDMRFR